MKTKKILSTAVVALFAAAGLTACGDDGLVIGVLQPVEHPALGAAREGFVAGLEEKMGDVKFTVNYQNAGGNDADLDLFSKSLVDKCDLTFGIGTGAAQMLKNASISKGYTKPVLFSAVTDPIEAKLLSNKDTPEGFVTGTSDMNPVEDQIDLIKEIIPTATKIGIMYTEKEVNSVVQANMADAKIKELGLTTVIKTCKDTSDITSTATALVGEGVDAIYLPTDNNIAANMNAVKSAADQGHVLVMCGEEGMLTSGGHVSLSIDYFNLGKEAGFMAADILLGNTTVSQSPVEYMGGSECKSVLSSRNLADSGITIPDSVSSAHSWVNLDA